MSARQIIIDQDIHPNDINKIMRLVDKRIEAQPIAAEDYVYVHIHDQEIRIRFFIKERIDNACKQTGMSPRDFIESIFKECIERKQK